MGVRLKNINIVNPFGIITLNEMISQEEGSYRVRCAKCERIIVVYKDSFSGKYIRMSFEMHGKAKFQCAKCKHENYVQKP